MHGHHLTIEDREIIAQMRAAGLSQARIARRLHCHPSTISRELRRNADSPGLYLHLLPCKAGFRLLSDAAASDNISVAAPPRAGNGVATEAAGMAQPTCEQLLAENRRLGAENQRLTRRVAELEARVQRLTAQVETALRARRRQAAPFAKGPSAFHARCNASSGKPWPCGTAATREISRPTAWPQPRQLAQPPFPDALRYMP